MSLINNLRKLPSLRVPSLPFVQRNNYSKEVTSEYERDPQQLFTDSETQELLRSMTQLHLSKVFRKTTVPDNTAECKFMTDQQLDKLFVKTIESARKRLEMPPVVQIKNDIKKVISKDPALTGFSDTKFVFTDITYGLSQSQRKVVIRETDGTLEYAPMEVKKRMNQLYFPLPGRNITTPPMFEKEQLERCLNEQKYQFILDRLTVQFEPYEREFHHISSRVYMHLNETKQHDVLRSTRHFGPMAFFYAWHRCIDDLLYDMIQRDYLQNGVELIGLMYKINGIQIDFQTTFEQLKKILGNPVDPALEELRKPLKIAQNDIKEEIKVAIGKTREHFEADELCLKFIDQYINSEHSRKKVQLELAVQTIKEITAEKKQLFEGLSKAHGLVQ